MFQSTYPENKTGCPLATVIFGKKNVFLKISEGLHYTITSTYTNDWEKNEAT